MDNTRDDAAKFAFFYMLSLVALIFMAVSCGMIIFQVINKNIMDALNQFRGRYSPDQLKFAISALIISVPIYYVTTRQIYKSLFSGALDKDSGIRKWLTYFILFVSSVIMLGWLVAVINSFLDGELTAKFILKSITSIGIAAAIFTFYFYDIRREETAGKKDKVIRIYFYSSLIIVIAVFIAAHFLVESPRETRNRKLDSAILEKFSRLDGAISTYYEDHKKLPGSLEELLAGFTYLDHEDVVDTVTKEKFEYKITGDKTYELCATFRTSNKDEEEDRYKPYKEQWPHEAGRQCLGQEVREMNSKEPIRIPVR